MKDLRHRMYDKLIENRAQMIERYNEKIDDVVYETELAKLFDLMIEIYHDKDIREKELIELMWTTFTNDFFRESLLETHQKTISFHDNTYRLIFYTNGDRKIELCYEATTNPWEVREKNPVKSREEEEKQANLIEAMNEYFSNKTFANLKKLAELYVVDEGTSIVKKIIQTIKECDKEELEDLLEEKNINDERKRINELSLQIYGIKRQEAIDFINSLSDLSSFRDANWKFLISNETLEEEPLEAKDLLFEGGPKQA